MADLRMPRLLIDRPVQTALLLRTGGHWLFHLVMIAVILALWESLAGPPRSWGQLVADLVERYQPQLDELQQRWETKLLYAWKHPGEDHIWDRQWEVLGLVWGGNLGEGQLEGTEICKLPWDQRTPRQRDDLQNYFLEHGSVIDPAKFAKFHLADLAKEIKALENSMKGALATRAPVMRAALTPRDIAGR